MLDYDREADRYDQTRGGDARASAAADAVGSLLNGIQGRVVDLAAGTGIVTEQLLRRGYDVYALDLSAGMLGYAAMRMPGRVVRADVTTRCWPRGGLGGAYAIWLLHLLNAEQVRQVIDCVAEALAPGGRFVTTVDKHAGRPGRAGALATDRAEEVQRLCDRAGLQQLSETGFIGHGQGSASQPDPYYRVVSFERPREA